MKKLTALILASALLMSLAACSSGSSGSTRSDVEIPETVLVDEAGIKITATGYDPDQGAFGPGISLLIENSSGQNLTVQTRDSSVNGYMVETVMSCDIAAGKKANDGVTFTETDMEQCGITDPKIFEFSFHIFTQDGWDDYLDTEPVTVLAAGAEGFTQTVDDTGDTVCDQNGIRIVSKGLSEDESSLGPCIVFFIDNTSDQAMTVQARNLSINGTMFDDYTFSVDIVPGKHAVDTLTFLDTGLEESGITDIQNVELSFNLSTQSFETVAETAPVTLTF